MDSITQKEVDEVLERGRQITEQLERSYRELHKDDWMDTTLFILIGMAGAGALIAGVLSAVHTL